MRVVKKGNGEKYIPPGHDDAVVAIKMFDPERGSAKVDVHMTTFAAGTSMAEEVHPASDHVLYVLAGSLEVRQGGKVFSLLSEGDALHVPAGDPHQMANISSSGTTVLMVTVPPV